MTTQRYIPGLNQRPVDVPKVPNSSIPKDVPPELIDDFKTGRKQVGRLLTLSTSVLKSSL